MHRKVTTVYNYLVLTLGYFRMKVTKYVLVRYDFNTVMSFVGANMGLWLGLGTLQIIKSLCKHLKNKVCNTKKVVFD